MAIQTHLKPTRIAATAALLAALGMSGSALCISSPALADEFSASPETEAALADAQARADEAQQQINALNNTFYEAQAAYDETTAQLEATNQAIADLQVTIDQKQAELAEAQEALANRMSAEYTAGPTNILDVILSAQDFNDFVNRLYYAGKLTDADAQAIQTVKDLKAELQASQDELVVQQAAQQQLQAQQEQDIANLQEQLAAAQEKLKDVKVSASAGGGMVKVEANGEMQLTSVQISPEACDPEDAELLQDMVLAAVNEALSSAQEAAGAQMSAATGLGGMNIPGLF